MQKQHLSFDSETEMSVYYDGVHYCIAIIKNPVIF